MNNGSNEFVLELRALLDQQKSKTQINADIRELERAIRKIKLTATLAKGDTKSEINQVIRQLESQMKQIKVQAKVDSRQLNREINNALLWSSFFVTLVAKKYQFLFMMLYVPDEVYGIR